MDKKRIAMLKRMEELREADKRSRVLLVSFSEILSLHYYVPKYSLNEFIASCIRSLYSSENIIFAGRATSYQ